MMEAVMEKAIEQRSFTRLAYEKKVNWACDTTGFGTAALSNVGRGGMGLRLNRFLAPGRFIELTFPDIFRKGKTVTLQARVAWSKPMRTASNEYELGAHLLYDDVEALGSVSEVFYAALNANQNALAASTPIYQIPGDLLTKSSWAS
jgi:hypothetical protein